mmetsp:Transcript_9266/g.30781  ORF Transcript_9266/g.30781 Transcript_9266/m.30781 type:complete len:443 (+) Transcript_9266:53-1381(+)
MLSMSTVSEDGCSSLASPWGLVEPYDFPDTGRGLRCVRAVAEGEELLAVPLEECWHEMAARRAPELAALADASLSETDAIALHLLLERAKGDGSERAAHLRSMPPVYDSTLFWSEAELAHLRGSDWLDLARRFAEELEADWAALQSQPAVAALLSRHGLGIEAYRWAYATVKSRAAEVGMGDEKKRLLAPRFDMFNHSTAVAPGSSHGYDEARQQLVVVAAAPYGAGEQAFISYGGASNGSLLLGGGFALRRNRFDAVEVTLTAKCDARRWLLLMMLAPEAPPPSQEEPPNFEYLQAPDQEQLRDGPKPFVTRHLLTAANPLPPALLAYVRAERLSDVELEAYEKKAKAAGTPLWEALRSPAPLDAALDLAALVALRRVLADKLDAYPTTAEQDEAFLDKAEPDAGAAHETAPLPAEAAAARRRWLRGRTTRGGGRRGCGKG